MNETIQAEGLCFTLRRSARRKTFCVTVDRNGNLVAHAPEGTDDEEIVRLIRSRLLWVHRKLTAKESLQPFSGAPEFVTGEAIFYLGKSFQLRLVENAKTAVEFDGTRFLLNRSTTNPERAFMKWFVQNGTEVIRRRVQWYQHRISNKPAGVKVSDLGYRWGSCSAKGNLHFNWRLLQLPLRLVDYVVAHEMAHLAVPDHSPRFWKVLELIQPDSQARREELDSKARTYLRFLPIETADAIR